MGTTAEKLTYLNGTKTAIKDVLNLAGANITTEPFRQYATSWQERLLYFMNNGTDVVWNNWNKVTGAGTTLTLSNTEHAPMSLVYKGNTSQTTYSGINIFKTSSSIWYNSASTATYNNTTDIFTFHRDSGVDYLVKSGQLGLKANTRYTIYMNIIENTMASEINVVNTLCNLPLNLIVPANTTGIYVASAMTNNLTFSYDIWWYCNSTGTLKAKIMLVEGQYTSSTIPAYQPYVGGTASPNPSYPQDIHVVSGDNSIEVSNEDNTQSASYPINLPEGMFLGWIPNTTYQDKIDKSTGINLFDNSNVNIGKTWNDTESAGRSMFYIETEPNKTYTLFAENWNQLYYDIVFLDHIGATSNIYESGWNDPSTTQKLTFTTTTGTHILGIHFKYTSAGNITMTQTMFDNATIGLCEGNISTPKYEPYGTNWYVKKEIGKKDNLVSDFVSVYTNYSNLDYIRFLKPSDSATKGNANNIPALFTFGKYAMNTNFNNAIFINSIVPNGEYNNFWFGVTKGTTTEQAQSILTNGTIYYPLATPTYETITDNTLIGQLEALKKSYEGQTNISQTNNDLPFELDVTALEG